MTPQFLRYAGVGALGTAVHYGILIALVQGAGVAAVAASTAGFIPGAFVNYALNHRVTFASRRAHRSALPSFFAIAGAGLVVNAAVMAAMLAIWPVHYLAAQVAATGVVLVTGFLANRRWTF